MTTHLSRYQEIAEALGRHGLGFLAGAVGLKRWIPSAHGSAHAQRSDGPYTTPQRVRFVLEELGPTFVKLGQLLSTRSDLLPPAYIAELSKLQDSGPPVATGQIRETIRQELGAEPEELFATFASEPLASASIGQAHSATTRDGIPVVVKVRRPDAVRRVHEDLDILTNLAHRLSRAWEPARTYNVTGIVDEFSQTLRAELDYLREAQNAERFATDFAHVPEVTIPRVLWETTTSRVLTLERMTGIKINDLPGLDAAGIDRRRLASLGSDIVLQMVFDHRFFHADLHPGNLFVRPDGGIALIDFGMVGELDEDLHDKLAQFLVAFTLRSPAALAEALIDLSVARASVDRAALRSGLTSFVAQYEDRPLREVNFVRLTTQLLGVLRDEHLQLPQEISLVLKVLFTIEGIGVQLDPDFDLIAALTPYARASVRERFAPAALAKRLGRVTAETGALLEVLPTRLRHLLETADEGGIEVHLQTAELDSALRRGERIGNRLVAGVITAALINGVGQLVARGNRWRSWQGMLVGAGLTVITTLSGYLAWTTRRPRR